MNVAALKNGASVTISGVTGNVAANGTWTVNNVTATGFTINANGTASGAFVNDGNGSWISTASQFGDDPVEVLAPSAAHPDGLVLAGYFAGPQTFLFDPAKPSGQQWSNGPTKLRPDQSDEESWVKLPDGSILTYDVFSSVTANKLQAERYIPPDSGNPVGHWVDASTLDSAHQPGIVSTAALGSELGPAFIQPTDGNVIFFGANGNTAIYHPATDTWTAGPMEPQKNLTIAPDANNVYQVTAGGPATFIVGTDDPGAVLPDGHILIALSPQGPLTPKGSYSFPNATYIYDYNPTTQTFTEVSPGPALGGTLIANNAFTLNMVLLPSGQVLLSNEGANGGHAFQIFTDSSSPPQDAWRPTITSVQLNGTTFTLTGTQLNGISEGSNYGDDLSSATNYPIVRLTDSSGNVFYATTSNWSTTGVATGSTAETVQFTLPAGKTLKDFIGGTLVVVANGISSLPQNITDPPSAGVSGTASGTISVGGPLSGIIGFSGNVSVSFDSSGVTVTGKNIQLTIAGQTLSGDVTFTRNSSTGQISVAVANMMISGGSGPVSVSGNLSLDPTGLSGTLTGGIGPATITVTFGNGTFTVTAGINASFNDTIGPVSISGTIVGTVSSTGTGSLSLNNLKISLGNGLVLVTGGAATLQETNFHITSGSVSGNGRPKLHTFRFASSARAGLRR